MPTPREALAQAVQHHQTGSLPEAEALYQQVLADDPHNPDALHLLGVLSSQLGKHALGASFIEKAIGQQPLMPAYHINLGIIYQALDRFDDALTSYGRASEIDPACVEAHYNRGMALKEVDRFEEAEASFRQALQLRPTLVDAHVNLGIALRQQGRPAAALASYEQALRLAPTSADALNNRGNALRDLKRFEEAATSFQEALRARPGFAEAYMNLARTRLLRGQWDSQTWDAYEWRWQAEKIRPPFPDQSLWDGTPLAGRTILLHTEQGLGDSLQFIRYAPLVRERGGRVLVACESALVNLLSRCPGIDQVVSKRDAWPAFDVQAPLLGLPRIFRTDPSTLPGSVPYLHPDPVLVDFWGRELAQFAGVKIGIAWHGNPKNREDRRRSVPFEHFAPLAALPGVTVFSLQKGHGAIGARALPAVIDWSARLDEQAGAFMDTAALMKHLDLVISADTAIAHLAGGLGVPVWVALSHVPDWRWLLDRQDSPWYPTMRLFRQRTWGNWAEVFERISAGAGRLLGGAPPIHSLSAPTAPTASPVVLQSEHYNRQGVALGQEGKLDEAVASFEQALRLRREDVDAQHNLAVALGQQGRLDAAVAGFRQALHLKPDHAEAHKNLGIILAQQGKLAEAVACLQRTLELVPDHAEASYALGNMLRDQGRLEEAAASFRQAIRARPDYAAAHNNLGSLLRKQGQLEEAVNCYRQALRVRPDYVQAHYNLAGTFQEQNKLDEAAAGYRQAIRIDPNYAEAHVHLGNVLRTQGQLDRALDHYRRVLELRPNDADASFRMGIVFWEQDKVEEAIACFEQALRLRPDHVPSHLNLGMALGRIGKLDEAGDCFQEALRLEPANPEAVYNLGVAFGQRGQMTQAVALIEQALELKPDYPEARLSLATSRFLMGKLEEAWPDYEARWQVEKLTVPTFPQPRWDGRTLEGRTILLHTEQGLGDTLQFIRYARLVKERGGRVIVACQAPLLRLLARCPGIDVLIPRKGALPEFDVHAPLLSLPGIFQTSLATIPADVPYLDADPALVEKWGRELGRFPGFKIGIVWQGNPKNKDDRRRSFPLECFAPLTRLPGVHVFSLQKGHGTEQIKAHADRLSVVDWGDRLDEASGPFMDTAAILKHLDLLITADTATAHLGGAMGVPVWVALSMAPDWRWMLECADCPWYPSMRIFRQRRWGDWAELLERITDEVRRLMGSRSSSAGLPGSAGDLLRTLQQAVQRMPDEPALHNNLGVALLERGDTDAAVASLREAVRLKPDQAEAHYNLARAWRARGDLDAASASLREALRLKPAYFEAHVNLGNALRAGGNLQEAIASYQEALRLRPDQASVHNNLGLVLLEQGNAREAAASFQQALRLKPDMAEAHLGLGSACRSLGRPDDALASFREAIRLRPGYAEAYNNLGNALRDQKRLEDAVAAHRQALVLKPNHPEAHYNLGNDLHEQGKLSEAVDSYREALRLNSRYAKAQCNLALVLLEQGKVEESVHGYQKALELNANEANAHFGIALAYLLQGDFAKAWPEYEWRWQTEGYSLPSFPQPPWDGGPLNGRTILLHAEQGLGDTMQFIRYAPLVQERGGRVIVSCQPPLVPLLSRCPGIDVLLARGTRLPPFDVHAPLLSLPGIFRTDLASIPCQVPYLFADQALIESWGRELRGLDGFKIGIAWQGNPAQKRDRVRSIPPEHFAPLARLQGVRLFSLQKRMAGEQAPAPPASAPLIDWTDRFDGSAGAFMDTAAMMTSLDLIVTSDTALAHLAGALGVRVWVALCHVPDWRWLLEREDCPWYPSMRLFRQSRAGRWDDVFERIVPHVQRLKASEA